MVTIFKIFPILVVVWFLMYIVGSRLGVFDDAGSGEAESVNTSSTEEGTTVADYVGDDGLLWMDVDEKDGLNWVVENYYTTMEVKDAIQDDNGFHFSFSPDEFEGDDSTQYAVLGQYDPENDVDTLLYAVVEAEISEGEIVDESLNFVWDPEEIGG